MAAYCSVLLMPFKRPLQETPSRDPFKRPLQATPLGSEHILQRPADALQETPSRDPTYILQRAADALHHV